MSELMAEIHVNENGVIMRSHMTLRDYYAGHALAGIISRGSEKINYGFYEDAAYYAYKAADAMLEARK